MPLVGCAIRPPPEKILTSQLAVLEQCRQVVEEAAADGLQSHDAPRLRVVSRTLEYVRSACEKLESDPLAGSAASECMLEAEELQFQILLTIDQETTDRMNRLAEIRQELPSLILPVQVEQRFAEVLSIVEFFRAFGREGAVFLAQSHFPAFEGYHALLRALLTYEDQIYGMSMAELTVSRLKRMLSVADRLSRYTRPGRLLEEPDLAAQQTRLVRDLRARILAVVDSEKKRALAAHERLQRIHEKENQLGALLEYRAELRKIIPLLSYMGMRAQHEEAMSVSDRLDELIDHYREIQKKEAILSRFTGDMKRMQDDLPRLFAQQLDLRDARRCVRMLHLLNQHFVTHRLHEAPEFIDAHRSIKTMQELHAALTSLLGTNFQRSIEEMMKIQAEFSSKTDVAAVHRDLRSVQQARKLLRMMGRDRQVPWAKDLADQIARRWEFYRDPQKHQALLEKARKQIGEMRALVDAIVSGGVTAPEIPKLRQILERLHRFSRYDSWFQGGVFTERRELQGYVVMQMNEAAQEKARRVEEIFRHLPGLSLDLPLEALVEEARGIHEFLSAPGVDKPVEESRAAELVDTLDEQQELNRALTARRARFLELRQRARNFWGEDISGLQAGDVRVIRKLKLQLRALATRYARPEGPGGQALAAARQGHVDALIDEMTSAVEAEVAAGVALYRQYAADWESWKDSGSFRGAVSKLSQIIDLLRTEGRTEAQDASKLLRRLQIRQKVLEAEERERRS